MKFYKVINTLSENEDKWSLGEVLNYNEYDIKKMNNSDWKNIIKEPIEIEVDKDFGFDEIDYNLSATGIQIVSEKLRNLILDEKLDFFPVIFSNHKPKQKYYALRINSFIDCVDESKSEYEYWSDEAVSTVPSRKNRYKSLNRFKIDELKALDIKIFRLLKYFSAIVINEELKILFENNNITGLGFSEIN